MNRSCERVVQSGCWESGVTTTAQIVALERRESDDLIGISLEEAKIMTGSVQRALVEGQAHEAIRRAATCPDCQTPLRRNGSHRMSYRTPFGRLDLGSPRFYRCRCQTKARQSFSPLANWLGDHTSPELQYLEAQFGRSAGVRCLRPHPGFRTSLAACDEHHDVEAAGGASRRTPR